jgi:hypothetical protein
VLSLPLAEAKRQTIGIGPAFNGAFGVDSQDILSIPDIGFGTFQLFPDQNNYGTTGTEVQPPSSDFDNTVNQTITWIHAQAYSAHTWVFPFLIVNNPDLGSALYSTGKPVVLTAFGLVTQDNLLQFVPVNDTSPIVNSPNQDRKRKSRYTTALDRHLSKNCYRRLSQVRILGHSAQVSASHRLILRTQHGCKVCTSFATKQAIKSTANDRAPQAGFQGGLGGLVQYQASGRVYEFLDDK